MPVVKKYGRVGMGLTALYFSHVAASFLAQEGYHFELQFDSF